MKKNIIKFCNNPISGGIFLLVLEEMHKPLLVNAFRVLLPINRALSTTLIFGRMFFLSGWFSTILFKGLYEIQGLETFPAHLVRAE